MRNKNLHSFRVEHELDDGDTVEGQFTCKKLSILDNSKVSKRKAELSGGMYCVTDDEGNPTGQGIDSTTETINYAIASCEVGVVSAPEWWDLTDVSDLSLLFKVFEEVMNWQNSFRRRAGKESAGDGSDSSSQTSSGEKQAEADNGNNPKKVVDKEVSAAMDA